MNQILPSEVFVFRTDPVRVAVLGLKSMLEQDPFATTTQLSDTTIVIPLIEIDYFVQGIVSMFDSFTRDPEQAKPMLRNYLLTEVLDSVHSTCTVTSESESFQALLDGCCYLVKNMLAIYEYTHCGASGVHSYDLIRVTATGTLIVSRSGVDC